MKSKIIIISAIIFFIASSAFLALVERKQSDENFQKNWWVIYFENPKDASLNFTIENHSDKDNFHWEVLIGNEKFKEGDAKIKKGSIWTSDVQENIPDEKIIIRVSSEENKKEIYKVIANLK